MVPDSQPANLGYAVERLGKLVEFMEQANIITDSMRSENRNVAMVTVVEGPLLQAEVAFTASTLQQAGLRPQVIATDFCTDEDGFKAELSRLNPALVLVSFAEEWRELVRHLAHCAQDAVGVPVGLWGSGTQRTSQRPDEEGYLWLPGPSEGLNLALFGTAPPDLALAAAYPWLPPLASSPTAGSLFAEMGAVGAWARRPSMADVSCVAMLARLESPSASSEPIIINPAAIEGSLRTLSGLQRVEWWDAHFGEAQLPAATHIAELGMKQSVRISLHGPELASPNQMEAHLVRLKACGVDRVVLTVDRVQGTSIVGSEAEARDYEAVAEVLHRLELEIGILLVIGVPGETELSGQARTAQVRNLRPHFLRAVPFEPTGGTEAWRSIESEGWLPAPESRWQREVHTPLNLPDLAPEGYTRNWSDALNLLAEVEVLRQRPVGEAS